MTIKFTNNATTTLASGITNVDTSLTVATGSGVLFPTLSGADVFYVTLANIAGNVEIVQVIARAGDVFTIVRGQDGTSGLAWSTGDKVELRPIAASMAAMAQKANNLSDLTNLATARTNLGLVIGTTVQAYDSATAKTNATQTFTTPQRGTITTNNTLSYDLNVTNNVKSTPTAGGALTFTNIASASGQSGQFLLVNGANYAITAAATTKISVADLAKISATGTYKCGYLCDGTNVYVTVSGNLA